MKFLIILRLKDTYYFRPAENRAKLQDEAFTYTEKYVKLGKLQQLYFTNEMRTAFAIWDVESNEELLRAILEYPLTTYSDVETYPVTEFNNAAKVLKDLAALYKFY